MLITYPYPLPPSGTPIVDQNGALTAKDGKYLILALLNRTGGSSGAPSIGTGLVVVAATPFNIVDDWSEFDTVAAGGVALIPPIVVGSEFLVFNGGLNSLGVQPQSGVQIDALGNGAAYPLASLKMQVFRCFTPTQIRSMQLG